MSGATTQNLAGEPGIRSEYGHWLARGREHQEAGRPIDALVCYRRALNANAYAVQARYRIGQVLRTLGREEEARAVWRGALALQPGHLLLQLNLAASARRAGDHAEAMEHYRRVLGIRPQHRGARMAWMSSGRRAMRMWL